MKEIFNNKKALLAIIGILAFLLYCPTLSFDYAQDDAIVFTDNQFVQQGIKGIPELLSKDTFYGFFKVEGKETLVQGGRYRPASLITFAIEKSLWGQKAFMSHLVNVLLYSSLCMLIFLFSRKLINQTRFKEHKNGMAFAIAALYTCHPIHTEAVANVKGRDEIMVALFGILACYLLIRNSKSLWNFILAILSLLIAYFSKEHALVFAIIIPLTIYFFYHKEENSKTLYTRAGILAASSIIFLLMRNSILSGAIAAESMELMNNPFLKYVNGQLVPFSTSETWASIIANLGKYIQLMLFPHPLTSDYYPYHFSIKTMANPLVLLSLIIHVGLVVLAILGLLKRRGWAYGIIFYFGFLFLMSNILFNIGTNISERFLFLPSFGLIFSIVYLAKIALGKRSASRILIIFLSVICLLLSIKTISRSQVWKDNFTLLTTDVKVSKNSAKALHGAAGALSTRGGKIENPTDQKRMIEQSNEYVKQALGLHPNYANAYLIQGNNYQYLREYDKAIDSYNTLLKLQPENKSGLQNLHIAFRDGGRYFGEQKQDLNKSISYLQQAYNMNSSDYETVRLLAVCNGMAGRKDLAIKYFTEAISLRSKDPYAYLNLGNAYYINGDEENGKIYHDKAVQLDPSFKEKIRR